MPAASRTRRRRPLRNAVTFHVSVFNDIPWPLERDWSKLPPGVLARVLRELGHYEVLTGGAAGVCRSWRRAARSDAELWRRVDERGFNRLRYIREAGERGVGSVHVPTRAAVRLSAGQYEAYRGELNVGSNLLRFLSVQAPLLKRLHLNNCFRISNSGLAQSLKDFPLLEELDLLLCRSIDYENLPWKYVEDDDNDDGGGGGGDREESIHDREVCEINDMEETVDDRDVFEIIANSCPRLKHFGHTKNRSRWYRKYIDNNPKIIDDGAAMAIARMSELRSLQLFRHSLTNDGLAMIIDSCPHLESLDIRNCHNINMDADLRAKFARIKTKKLLKYDFMDYDYSECEEFLPASPISMCSTCVRFWDDDSEDEDFSDYISDSFSELEDDDDGDSFYYPSDRDEIDLEEDWMLNMSMRRSIQWSITPSQKKGKKEKSKRRHL